MDCFPLGLAQKHRRITTDGKIIANGLESGTVTSAASPVCDNDVPGSSDDEQSVDTDESVPEVIEVIGFIADDNASGKGANELGWPRNT